MKNGIARANPIANSSKISTRDMIRGWELVLSSANVKLKLLLYFVLLRKLFWALQLYIPKSLEDSISTEIIAASLVCIFTGGWILCLPLKNVYVIGREPFSEMQDKVTVWPFFAWELGELSTGLETGSLSVKLRLLLYFSPLEISFSALHLYSPRSLAELIVKLNTTGVKSVLFKADTCCLCLNSVYLIGGDPESEWQERLTFWYITTSKVPWRGVSLGLERTSLQCAVAFWICWEVWARREENCKTGNGGSYLEVFVICARNVLGLR